MYSQRKRSRLALSAALALAASSALAGEITLFEGSGFRGDSMTLMSPAVDLEAKGFATASSVLVRNGVWQACSDVGFRGQCLELQPGEYRNVNATLVNGIASVREIAATTTVAPPLTVATEPRIVLYERTGLNGGSVELTKTMGGLGRASVYGGADAALVYGGVWRLCSRPYFRGECMDFAPGRYENLGALTGRVNSAELVAVTNQAPISIAPPPTSTGRVVLYESSYFRGNSVVIDGSVASNLDRVGFKDRAASIRVEGGTWMFCTGALFQGQCRTLGPGEYAYLPRDVDRKIASARRINDVQGALSSAYR